MKYHVAVLFHRLGPYHYARLKAAASVMQVTALEFSHVDETYAWLPLNREDDFRREVLFPQVSVEQLSSSLIVQRTFELLDRIAPQVVVVPGWGDRCALAALRWSIDRHVPAIVMSETTAWDDQRKGWKELLKRWLVSLFSSALVGGSAHVSYLMELGLGQARVFLGYDAVDNDYFLIKSNELLTLKSQFPDSASQFQKRYGLPGKYFLASARFVEKKNLPRLIQAYAHYRELACSTLDSQPSTPPWSLVLLGDGPLRSTLNSQLSTLNLHQHVLMPGFKQYDELPAYYAFAGAFVHASTTEQWGLVVNEAMASGLPVLVSNRCGCAQDLVKEGVNGFTFDPYNVEQLAQLMFELSTLNSQLSTMGDASRQIISAWGPDRFASGLKSAVDVALRSPVPSASWLDRIILRLLLLR